MAVRGEDVFEKPAEKAAEFWAFQKLGRPHVPEVEGHTRTPVDAFVLTGLEAKRLSFAPPADRLTLMRRAHLDLVGLPPSPEEIETFLADDSPVAYERLLDRLIDSPHFGERWGRHWLDVAGFVPDRESRWRYRDYVIAAFNSDKPYDQFLVEQIAGDELVDWRIAKALSPAMKELLVATGLLRSASDNTGNVMTDIPSYRYAILFDTLEILGTAVMGLTLQCARCHTHKYDPIAQRDYYRLMALFTPAYNPEKWLRNGDRTLPEGIDGLYDVDSPPTTHLLTRGDISRPGSEVQAGFIRALSESDSAALVPAVNPEAQGATSGRRLSFARWLTEPDTPAGGLVARVMMNRLWHHLFGRGIVATPGNLGRSGAQATNPELIDYLASEFVRNGWRIKPIVKLLVSSTVYRQGSTSNLETQLTESVDPDNGGLWRMPLRRLESEVIRDSILAASGKLGRAMDGPGVPIENLPDGSTIVNTKELSTPTSQWRRSVYLASQRIGGTPQPSVTLLSVFDQPVFKTNCTQRRNSAVVVQSLTLLNDKFVLDQAQYFADRLLGEAGVMWHDQIRLAFQIALARPPTQDEADWSLRFYDEQQKAYQPVTASLQEAERKALTSLCHALFNFNNFLYVE
jgi:hypothetical protein